MVRGVVGLIFKVIRVITMFISHLLQVVLAFIFKVLMFVFPILLVGALIAAIVWV
jgi:hypothetical protein